MVAAYPWLGSVRYVQPFRPWRVLAGLAVLIVAIPTVVAIVHAVFREQLAGYIFDAFTYIVITCAFAVPVIAMVVAAFRRRLVVCDHGILLGPTAPTEAWRWEAIDLQSLTPLTHFSRVGREVRFGQPLIQDGSSRSWGRRGIVFRLWLPHTYPPPEEPFWNNNPRLFGYWFGTNDDPRRLLAEIASAAADHGIEGARRLPGLTEEPVALTGRPQDAARQLPRLMSDPRTC